MVDPTTSSSDERDEESVDEGLVTSRPPTEFLPVRTWTIGGLRELAELRAAILAEVGRDADPVPELDSVAHRLVLVASELATNALRHGVPPTVVRLMRDERTYLLDVADQDLSTVPYVAGDRPPGQGGFGLQIARRLSLDVGWYATDSTKHVWARFPVPE